MGEYEPIVVLLADDDEDDRFLIKEAFLENKIENTLQHVSDGEELMDYLKNRGKFAEKFYYPRPDLILLDLNMPRKDGREALKEIKNDPELKSIPVIVLTTSSTEEDIQRTYEMGVNSFITKPVTYDGMVDLIKTLNQYWFQLVKLPAD